MQSSDKTTRWVSRPEMLGVHSHPKGLQGDALQGPAESLVKHTDSQQRLMKAFFFFFHEGF